MNKKYISGVAALVVLVGAGSFYGGMMYGKKNVSDKEFGIKAWQEQEGDFRQAKGEIMNGRRGQSQGQNQGQEGRMGRGGGFVSGEITAKDDKSITVKISDGNSRIVYFSDSTPVSESTRGSISDLSVGKKVFLNGYQNSDGSILAQDIRINPEAASQK